QTSKSSMDGVSTMSNSTSLQNINGIASKSEIAAFGAIHLNITSIVKAIDFWTKIGGLKLRTQSATSAELGTETQTLVVVHQTAKSAFKKGYSGIYHFAIHLPNQQEFAKTLYRLQQYDYPHSPTDHTMTQSIYLEEADGITVEFALETPERYKRVITEGGLFMEDADGTIRSASAALDTEYVLKGLTDKDLTKSIAVESKIGHVHFSANDVTKSNDFFRTIGFTQFNYLPQFMYADLGMGGVYQHRIALNSWHGKNRPLAPAENAGLEHYEIIFNSKEQLQKAIAVLAKVDEYGDEYWTLDPTGNKVLLTHKK
ncbi:MAG: VOC family protein, partial [Meiothermus sp.]|nr:VOC family protein [Meiothermus sp.]